MAYYVYMMTNRYRNHLIKDSFTARYHITRLVYFEMTEDVRSAIEWEKQIKSWNRARKEALVESQNPTWEDQYPIILQG